MPGAEDGKKHTATALFRGRRATAGLGVNSILTSHNENQFTDGARACWSLGSKHFVFAQSAVASATANSVFAGIWAGMAGTGRQKCEKNTILVVIIDTNGRDSGPCMVRSGRRAIGGPERPVGRVHSHVVVATRGSLYRPARQPSVQTRPVHLRAETSASGGSGPPKYTRPG